MAWRCSTWSRQKSATHWLATRDMALPDIELMREGQKEDTDWLVIDSPAGLHGDAQTRERIALALAQQNSCEYCLSAHSALARKAGLDNAEIEANRHGSSRDAKAAAAVKFARALVARTGEVTTAELLEVRNAGYTAGEIVENILHVGLNIMTNILGKASRVAIDFPRIDVRLAS